MATPKVLIKRSSVAGRVPGDQDLDYGEIAINYQDGKIYYKDASNNIKAFIDSATVQALINAIDTSGDIDSAAVTGIVDSSYIQTRVPESYLATLIDSAYISARQAAGTDSATVLSLIAANSIDSARTISLIDSAYVQARQVDLQRDSSYITNTIQQNLSQGTFILGLAPGNDPVENPSDFVATLKSKITAGAGIIVADGTGFSDPVTITATYDSSSTTGIIDSAYVQARQITYNTSDFADSTYVQSVLPTFGTDYIDSAAASAIITADVTKSFVDALGTNADTLDGFEGTHYLQYSNLTGTPTVLDSAQIVRFTVDSSRGRRMLTGGTGVNYNANTGVIAIDSNSTVTINRVVADSGEIKLLQFNTTEFTDVSVPDNLPADPPNEGDLFYFQGPDALTYSNASINVKIGQDEVVRVYNNSGSDIAKGKAVYVTGAANDFPTISLAKADNFSTIYTTIGLTSHAITNGTFGFVTMRGLYGGLNTASFNAGDIVHVSVDSAGELTNSQPAYPNFPFEVGTVLVADSAGGGNVGGCIQVNLKAEVFEGIRVQGNSRFDADLTVAGNLNILGAETITQVQNLQVTDNFIYIGAGDTVTTLFDGTGTNDGLIKDYYEGDSSKYYFVYIYDADSVNGGDLIRLERGDSAGAFDDGTSVQINFDSDGGSETLDLSVDRTLLPLRNNIKITFETSGGHDSGDYWYGLASPINQDLGIVGNYNLPDQPYSHAGFFRDASDQKFKIFNKYDPEVEGNINTSHSSFELGTMVANTFEGDLTGDVTGTVSSISNHTTTGLTEGSNLYYTTARANTAIDNRVDSAYVQARQITYNTSDFTDSSYVTGLPVSTFTNDANYLDSTTVQNVIDSAYIASVVETDGDINITINNEITSTVDSAYVNARVNAGNFLDSAEAIALIDSAYVQARVDSSFVNNLISTSTDIDVTIVNNITSTVDSDYVNARVNAGNFLDSAEAIALIDSEYIKARIDSSYVNTLISSSTDIDVTITNNISTTVDSDYIEARRAPEAIFQVSNNGASAYSFTGDGFDSAQDNPTLYLHRGMSYKFAVNANGHPFQIRTSSGGSAYNEGVTNNGSEVNDIFFTPHMDAPNSLVYQCTIHSGMVGDIVILDNNSFLDSSSVTGVIDATYIQSNQTTYSNVSEFTNDAGYLTNATTTSLIDSAYVQARQTAGTDSAATIALIEATVDSAYVALREANAGGAGTDSATVITLIQQTVDSSYIQIREAGDVVSSTASISHFVYTADSGQTAFTGADDNGNTLSYTANSNNISVFLNGILQVDSADFTETSNSTVTLPAVDSGDIVSIIKYTLTSPTGLDSSEIINLIDSDYVQSRTTAGTDSAATIALIQSTVDSAYVQLREAAGGASGVDSAATIALIQATVDSAYVALREANTGGGGGAGQAYAKIAVSGQDDVDVDSSADTLTFEAGTGITITTDANTDTVTINSLYAPTGGALVTKHKYTASSGQTAFTGNDDNGTNLVYNAVQENVNVYLNGVLLIDSDDFTFTDSNTVTLLTAADSNDILQIVEYSEPTAILGGGGVDSASVITIVDSAYVQARQTAGTDSAATIALIQATVDSAYVTARQNLLDSNLTTQLVDSAYIQLRDRFQEDSNFVTNIVESSYIQIHVPESYLSTIIDADYINNRHTTFDRGDLELNKFIFTADSGQTVFTGNDKFGTALSIEPDNVEVYLNGVLLEDTTDWSGDSNSITLVEAADSGYSITIIETIGRVNTFKQVTHTAFEYTADSGDTVFSGVDDNGRALDISSGAINVHLNGILLSETNDYTISGNQVTLVDPADSADFLTIVNTKGTPVSNINLVDYEFTNQTGNTLSGNNLKFSNNSVHVYKNGLLLRDNEYTTSSGNTINLTTQAVDSDVFIVSAYTGNNVNNWTEATTNETLLVNSKKIVDTSSAITLTMPSNPTLGDEVKVIDGTGNAATNNITLTTTDKIQSSDSDFVIDINRAGLSFVYYNDSQGWILIQN